MVLLGVLVVPIGRWATAWRDPTPACRRMAASGLEEELELDHVEPAAVLAAHLPLDPDQLEAAGAVEADRHLVVAHDPGHDGVEAVLGGQPDQLRRGRPAPPPGPAPRL